MVTQEQLQSARYYPYIVCPKSGNTYALTGASSVHICSCGCGKNLAEMADEQNKSGKIQKVVLYVNTTEVESKKYKKRCL